MVKLIAQQTADNLSIKEWGKAQLEIVCTPTGDSFIAVSSLIKFYAEGVCFYDNKNILIKLKGQERDTKNRYVLLTPNNFSEEYAEISKEVFDDKYRRVVGYNQADERLVSLINEESGKREFPLTHWKDILDVHDEIATISFVQKESGRTFQSLVRFKQNLFGKELIAREIVHVQESLYKYRTNGHLFYLYNSNNHLSSDEKTGYTDIIYISDQLAMGVIDNVQWDFINIHTMEIKCTSFQEPVFENDIIHIVSYNDNDEEIEFNINFSGTRLSEGNELDLSIESGKVESTSNLSFTETTTRETIASPVITIGRFIIVNDDSVKKSSNGNYIFSKKSLDRPCRIERGTICWILIKEGNIIITTRDGIINSRRTILYENHLPGEFNTFSILAEKKWYIEDCIIRSDEEDIVQTAIDNIRTKLQEKIENLKVRQQAIDNKITREAKDVLQLKNIYDFLKQQKFDDDAIYKSVYILFPAIEQFADLTNVKAEHSDVYNNVIKLTEIRDQISSNPSNLIERLSLNEKDLAILNYYTKAKGLSIDTAIEHIGQESSTGSEILAKYKELMQTKHKLFVERAKLRKLIVDDLINGLPNIADTSAVLIPHGEIDSPVTNLYETLPKNQANERLVIDESKSIQIILKEKILQFHLNEVVKYELFENKKVYNFKHDIHYVPLGRDILIFISKNKASELDKEHPHNISLRGNGEDKRFSQVFTHINRAIKNQRENNCRIFVFEHNDGETCKFFDEIQYLDYDLVKEDGRDIIMFKLKSLVRFYTEQ